MGRCVQHFSCSAWVSLCGLCLALLICLPASAQYVSLSTTNAGSWLTFNTASDLTNGGTRADAVQIGFSVAANANIPRWKLTVQEVGTVGQSSGSGPTLDPGNLYLSHDPNAGQVPAYVQAIHAPLGEFQLSNNEITLIASSDTAIYSTWGTYFNLLYNLRIAGGQGLWALTDGTYQFYLLFRVYDQNGHLVNSAQNVFNFGRWCWSCTPSDGGSALATSLSVAAAAKTIALDFNTPEHFHNGVTVNYPDALVAFSSAGYTISVAAQNPYFSNAEGYTTLPVSIVNVASMNGSTNSAAVYYTIPLSNSMQAIIRNSQGSSGSASDEYSLSYFINSGQNQLLNASAGNYQAILVFSIDPL